MFRLYRYGYDRNSNPLYKANTVATGLDELYAYDRFDRLTSMKRGTLTSTHDALTATPATEAAWTLDRLGNWSAYQTKTSGTTDLAQTRTANTVNEIASLTNTTGPTWANIAYDAAGNMTTGPKGEDETTLLKFVYDGWNRLVQVKDASDALVATYAYDGTGRRINKSATLSLGEDTYYNAAYQAVETRLGRGYEQTVFDAKYIDAVIVRYPNSRLENAQTLFFTHDRMFNVTGVWDASRTTAERYRYTPYGERNVLDATLTPKTGNASTVDQRRGHQGLLLDGETGAYYNRARFVNPRIGAFNNREPLLANYVDGSNLYCYARNNPLLYNDSMGLKASQCMRTPVPGVWETQWHLVSLVPGSVIGQTSAGAATIGGAIATVMALFVKGVYDLLYCCDVADNGYFKWSLRYYEAESVSPVDTVLVVFVTAPLVIPFGGQALDFTWLPGTPTKLVPAPGSSMSYPNHSAGTKTYSPSLPPFRDLSGKDIEMVTAVTCKSCLPAPTFTTAGAPPRPYPKMPAFPTQ